MVTAKSCDYTGLFGYFHAINFVQYAIRGLVSIGFLPGMSSWLTLYNNGGTLVRQSHFDKSAVAIRSLRQRLLLGAHFNRTTNFDLGQLSRTR